MADTADRRSEGKSLSPQAQAQRRLREQRRAEGVCIYCGKVPVLNRATCYECSDRTNVSSSKSYARKFLKDHEITEVTAADLRVIVKNHHLARWEQVVIIDLIEMLDLAFQDSRNVTDR